MKVDSTSLENGGRLPGDRLRVRAACHATVMFDRVVPKGAELVVEYLYRGRLLARERRPVPAGAARLEIKIHPRASHIVCSLQRKGREVDGSFRVAAGGPVEAIGRYFIVVGAMKAGTTTLFNLLAQHPAICRTWVEVPGISFTKEINYFRKLYRKNHKPWHYDWRFPFNRAEHAWTLDVSPGYAKWPGSKGVARRIAALPGDVRLAYILRDPVDRIESHLAHTLKSSGELKSLNHCIRTSRYALHLDKFTSHLPRENILLLNFDELSRNPDAVMSQVCNFLSIQPFTGHTVAHNVRSVDFRLDAVQRAEMAAAVRPDMRRLVDQYGFKPAQRWLQNGS